MYIQKINQKKTSIADPEITVKNSNCQPLLQALYCIQFARNVSSNPMQCILMYLFFISVTTKSTRLIQLLNLLLQWRMEN